MIPQKISQYKQVLEIKGTKDTKGTKDNKYVETHEYLLHVLNNMNVNNDKGITFKGQYKDYTLVRTDKIWNIDITGSSIIFMIHGNADLYMDNIKTSASV